MPSKAKLEADRLRWLQAIEAEILANRAAYRGPPPTLTTTHYRRLCMYWDRPDGLYQEVSTLDNDLHALGLLESRLRSSEHAAP